MQLPTAFGTMWSGEMCGIGYLGLRSTDPLHFLEAALQEGIEFDMELGLSNTSSCSFSRGRFWSLSLSQRFRSQRRQTQDVEFRGVWHDGFCFSRFF